MVARLALIFAKAGLHGLLRRRACRLGCLNVLPGVLFARGDLIAHHAGVSFSLGREAAGQPVLMREFRVGQRAAIHAVLLIHGLYPGVRHENLDRLVLVPQQHLLRVGHLLFEGSDLRFGTVEVINAVAALRPGRGSGQQNGDHGHGRLHGVRPV